MCAHSVDTCSQHPREDCSPSIEQLWGWLSDIADPEIPVISIVDLGIVRDVAWIDHAEHGSECVVTVTPTYSGCPATEVIGTQIREALQARGVPHVRLQLQLSPAWTTDWMSADARRKLRGYGIAPPVGCAAENCSKEDMVLVRRSPLIAPVVPCPLCGSTHTAMISASGSTPCKSLYRCQDCLEPFDYFKCH
jgi:ring-1,2-phenylacetyl-CoA epoxidase subunit PaaD